MEFVGWADVFLLLGGERERFFMLFLGERETQKKAEAWNFFLAKRTFAKKRGVKFILKSHVQVSEAPKSTAKANWTFCNGFADSPPKKPSRKTPPKKEDELRIMKFIQLQNLAAHWSRVLGWTYPFTWASITWTYMQLREGIKISTMNLGTHDPWPGSESPIGKRKLIFPSLKVDMLVLMVPSFWVVSFFHSGSTSTYHSPSWTWNPEKKNHGFQVRNLLKPSFRKTIFQIPYILELWLGKIVFSMVPEIWSFFLTRLLEFCPSQLVCLQNFGPRTTIFL